MRSQFENEISIWEWDLKGTYLTYMCFFAYETCASSLSLSKKFSICASRGLSSRRTCFSFHTYMLVGVWDMCVVSLRFKKFSICAWRGLRSRLDALVSMFVDMSPTSCADWEDTCHLSTRHLSRQVTCLQDTCNKTRETALVSYVNKHIRVKRVKSLVYKTLVPRQERLHLSPTSTNIYVWNESSHLSTRHL